MKISVIIAAYNAEKYLSDTLDSLKGQTISDYEIIVINDGSMDHTLDILTKYKSQFSNYRIINKQNGGPSSARNTGIDIATGEFLYFLDADDILEPDALESLYNAAVSQNADLVIAKYDIFNRYRITPVTNIDNLVTQTTIDKYDLMILWTFSLWNKLFRKSIVDQFAMRFAPISYSEDGAFLMNYVYHTQKITGLDQVIFHYRRLYDGVADSITASVSSGKINDYITAHQMILASAEKSILHDYPQYHTIDEAVSSNISIQRYRSEIIRKELQVLLGQFYVKFWTLDETTVSMIVREVALRLDSLNLHNITQLINAHPDLSLFHLPATQAEMLDMCCFTAVLYGDSSNETDFIKCLHSLTIQNLTNMKIVVPLQMQASIISADLMQGNIVFLDAASEDILFESALNTLDTLYIAFCDAKFIYVNNAFKHVFKRFILSATDFISEQIYHCDYGTPQPVLINRIACTSQRTGISNSPWLSMDYTLANKFFRNDFILQFADLFKKTDMLSCLPVFFDKGYYSFFDDNIIIFNDSEENFLDYIATDKSRSFIEQFFLDNSVTLNSPSVQVVPGTDFIKLQQLPKEQRGTEIKSFAIRCFKKLPLKNQVLFFSVRKDGELEGNAKALYPYVKGKKRICAKQLPHNLATEIKMFYHLMTSKVIVTDDYVRYLRHFTLRKDQRVIQLWHACGAFKKFGQHGTNLNIRTDLATHAQYNIVSVSSDFIRPIYANAFDINLQRVKALGCPRTDDFYNENLVSTRKSAIFEKHPEFQNKFLIIYAPTFRDIGSDRTNFKPDLNFDELSAQLLPNQMFLICPHPIMKNNIISKTYDNICVIRDFSTNDMMLVSDMLITDYSSVIFEYALLKKPIAFFCYDMQTYNRGFYLNYPKDLPGEVYTTQQQLTDYLIDEDKHALTAKYDTFLSKYMSACDGHSCERIAALINNYMEDTDHE